MLLVKLVKASNESGIKEIAIAGGVAANKGLRNRLQSMAVSKGWNVYIPDIQYCTDNAGMIAIAAWYKYLNNDWADLTSAPDPRWSMQAD